ncbi:receptor-like serine/threonine-protein kinase At4g25390 [Abrus precatorius]|uniref:Receptor-like serine/threonine-protein kinase At4g25390 n=1 Tax=Abrus precatorius TaxID=3816 RepID=A0A8B8MDG9_ABRPR|nr:receptor-like serine/threonine-protein kinase At4g25390 [Abrus precatorius]
MPSRQLSTSAPAPNHHRHNHHVLTPLLASTASVCSLILLLLLCLRKRKRTTPSSDSDSNPPHPYSYALLRRATSSFSTRLGHGGFGPVFSGSLSGKPVAVKLMDSASLQGEREFHNELFFASRLRSPLVVPAIGFSSDPKRRRFLLVYHLMHNGNLHDALLRRKTPHLALWKNRFSIILDIARGIQYLHSCDPPVIHGDIKPSNILLDDCFNARIGDFGLARLKTEPQLEVEVEIDGKRKKEELESDGGSELETQSVNTEQSFEGETQKKNGKGLSSNNEVVGVAGWGSDYVMDWIGKEVKKERAKEEWVGSASGSGTVEKKKSRKKLEWWESMDEEKGVAGCGVLNLKKDKRRGAREWWKEEYSEELARKKKKKKKKQSDNDDWWETDDGFNKDVNVTNKGKKKRIRKSSGSVDSWFSGELRRARWNSYDSNSGEIGKSGGVSSTQSMRGTVFYVAPEYGYDGDVSEKCDVYSFGVLLLVIVSGRRPLQVTASPLSEFQRANLVSWARECGRRGKLLEVVDESIEWLNKEEALLCMTVALLCLLKSPARRPSMKEVVGMLSGDLEAPQLPVEYSHSQESHLPFKSRKGGR